MAQKVGTDQGTYWRWEQGKNEPEDYFQLRLADLFEVTVRELGFGGDG